MGNLKRTLLICHCFRDTLRCNILEDLVTQHWPGVYWALDSIPSTRRSLPNPKLSKLFLCAQTIKKICFFGGEPRIWCKLGRECLYDYVPICNRNLRHGVCKDLALMIPCQRNSIYYDLTEDCLLELTWFCPVLIMLCTLLCHNF